MNLFKSIDLWYNKENWGMTEMSFEMEEKDMTRAKIGTEIHQIRPYQAHKGADLLHIDKKESTHYNATTDRQIRVPIGDIKELRRRLRGSSGNV